MELLKMRDENPTLAGGKPGGRGSFQNAMKGGEVWLKTTLATENSGAGK